MLLGIFTEISVYFPRFSVASALDIFAQPRTCYRDLESASILLIRGKQLVVVRAALPLELKEFNEKRDLSILGAVVPSDEALNQVGWTWSFFISIVSIRQCSIWLKSLALQARDVMLSGDLCSSHCCLHSSVPQCWCTSFLWIFCVHFCTGIYCVNMHLVFVQLIWKSYIWCIYSGDFLRQHSHPHKMLCNWLNINYLRL